MQPSAVARPDGRPPAGPPVSGPQSAELREIMSTAVVTCDLRAAETKRLDRLVDDPHAARLVQAATSAGFRPGWEHVAAGIADQVALRTRFYDDYLLAGRQEGCDQVVVLGAGLDLRGHRLPWTWPTRLYELDLPELVAFKEQTLSTLRLTPRCTRIVVGADLRGPWLDALTDAGFRWEAPTAWLAEGVLTYLPAPDAVRLLEGVTANSAPSSRFAAEYVVPRDAALLGGGSLRPTSLLATVASTGRDVRAMLDELGWSTVVHGHGELASRYGRAVPDGTRGGYIVATCPRS